MRPGNWREYENQDEQAAAGGEAVGEQGNGCDALRQSFPHDGRLRQSKLALDLAHGALRLEQQAQDARLLGSATMANDDSTIDI